MNIQPFVLGIGYTNSYVVYGIDNKAYIIDAPNGTEALEVFVEKNKLEVVAILLTHGHYDHVLGLPRLKMVYPKAEIYIDNDDACFLLDGGKANIEILRNQNQLISFFRTTFENFNFEYKAYGKTIGEFEVIKTPGHTHGSVSIYSRKEKVLFSGDTLFRQGIGRWDLGGNYSELINSIEKLKQLDEDTEVFPGHGEFTSIGMEKMYNPYF